VCPRYEWTDLLADRGPAARAGLGLVLPPARYASTARALSQSQRALLPECSGRSLQASTSSSRSTEKDTHLRVHILPALGDLLLDQVSNEALTEFFGKLREHGYQKKGRVARSIKSKAMAKRSERAESGRKDRGKPRRGLSEKSIKNIRTTLQTLLGFAVKWGYLSRIASGSAEFVQSALGCGGVGRTGSFPAVVARAWQISGQLGGGDFSAARRHRSGATLTLMSIVLHWNGEALPGSPSSRATV
jgi:hypothetical protein